MFVKECEEGNGHRCSGGGWKGMRWRRGKGVMEGERFNRGGKKNKEKRRKRRENNERRAR